MCGISEKFIEINKFIELIKHENYLELSFVNHFVKSQNCKSNSLAERVFIFSEQIDDQISESRLENWFLKNGIIK